jgi:transposase-like protein
MNISDSAADYLVDKKEGMRHLTASLLNEVMQLEALRQIQARPYERDGKRRAHRNGSRNRNLKTIHGEANLKKPQFRELSFRTEIFARYSRVEESVRVAVAESFLQGVSTRRIPRVMREFGLKNITASEVSRIAKKLDEEV